MQDFPHHYRAGAAVGPEGAVRLEADGLPTIVSGPPAEFGGSGAEWSPETLLVAAVADCFILTFRAIAAAGRLEWSDLDCEVEGVLDRVDRVTRFTGMTVQARLELPASADQDKARKFLQKAEQNCLVSRSLACDVHLEVELVVV
jgi:peroxiredoxin-like protein